MRSSSFSSSLRGLVSLVAAAAVVLTVSSCERGDRPEAGSAAPATASRPSPAQGAYDLKFIDSMTEHHKSALQMAKMAATKASHDELKQLAQKILDGQEAEIAQMRIWRDHWFVNAAPAVDHGMPGMKESMGMDMSKLMRASGAEFDHEFIDMMTKHHEAGIAMANDALARAQREEIKGLARKIVKDQSKDNETMKSYSARWLPGHTHDAAPPRGQ